MAVLTGKGLAKLEILRDYWPPEREPGKRYRFSHNKMRQKYLLSEVEKSPKFIVEQHSILRPDWDYLKAKGLIEDTTVEPTYIIQGDDTYRPLYRKIR